MTWFSIVALLFLIGWVAALALAKSAKRGDQQWAAARRQQANRRSVHVGGYEPGGKPLHEFRPPPLGPAPGARR